MSNTIRPDVGDGSCNVVPRKNCVLLHDLLCQTLYLLMLVTDHVMYFPRRSMVMNYELCLNYINMLSIDHDFIQSWLPIKDNISVFIRNTSHTLQKRMTTVKWSYIARINISRNQAIYELCQNIHIVNTSKPFVFR